MQNVSYQVRGRDGEVKGVLSFSYKFGQKTSSKRVRSSSAQRPRAVRGTSGHSSSGSGIGIGFLGGLLISDVANSAGCGGGGCGGGDDVCGGGGGVVVVVVVVAAGVVAGGGCS
ncbi:hypothetical protein HanIR_Chr08g0348491 [Helianthus annuus]|nr:hypothetical protein HanIR_Chr08g0348491 [Helianthus annuus]